MATEYNRIVCNFCLHARTCERLRTAVNCPACPESLPCAQTNYFAGTSCAARMKEWRESGLPSKDGICFLAEQLLVYLESRAISEMFVPTTGYTAEELDTAAPDDPQSQDAAVVCPRCGKGTAAVARSYEWSVKMFGQGLQKSATLRCRFCGLDSEHTYG